MIVQPGRVVALGRLVPGRPFASSVLGRWAGEAQGSDRRRADGHGPRRSVAVHTAVCHNPLTMKLLRLKPGHGEIVLAEGDVDAPEQERELIEAFRRELDAGMWAAVPLQSNDGRRQAELVKSFSDVPRDAERVIFFPRAAGGAPRTAG
jgi:hypothetical protein